MEGHFISWREGTLSWRMERCPLLGEMKNIPSFAPLRKGEADAVNTLSFPPDKGGKGGSRRFFSCKKMIEKLVLTSSTFLL